MTNEQILKKAIEKAAKNGFCKEAETLIEKFSTNDIIFSHDFAKAFWGERDMITAVEEGTWAGAKIQPFWQYHLQQMVLEEEPLLYLKKFL